MTTTSPYHTADYETELVRLARRHAGANNCHSVEIVEGRQPPRLEGQSYYWTTPSGRTVVRHPNAYGWMVVYHPSTLHVTVGRMWGRGRIATR